MSNLFILTGCSKGLGKAILEELLVDDKNTVVGISRSPATFTADNFKHIALDLGEPVKIVEKLHEIFPEGDHENVVLINNAGWVGEIAPLGKLDPVGMSKIQLTNVVAPGILMNEFVRKFRQGKMQKIVVNISSGAAYKDIDGWSGYCSSKVALNRMTMVAQEESDLHGYGIKYFALSPGIIDTPMQEDIRKAKEEDFSALEMFKSYKANKDLSSPEEVAKKVIYLLKYPGNFREVLQDVRKF